MNNRAGPCFSATAVTLLVMAPALSPALAQGATGDGRLDAVIESGTLRVCTTGDYKPFTYYDATSDTYEGIDIDMARSLAQALGVEPEFVGTTWKALLSDFTADKCDIAMGGISVTLDRQKEAFFSDAYLVNGKAPIARCEDKARFQTIEDIDKPGVTVIVNPGGTNEKFVRESLSEATIEVYPDNVTIFKQVLDGEADVMIAESIETVLQENLNPGLLCDQSRPAPEVWRNGLPAAAGRRRLQGLRRSVAASRQSYRRVRPHLRSTYPITTRNKGTGGLGKSDRRDAGGRLSSISQRQ